MARVSSTSRQVLALTGGLAEFDVPAATVRELLAVLQDRFPGLGELVSEAMAIAIDGEIHAHALAEPLGADAEVVLIPRIAGG